MDTHCSWCNVSVDETASQRQEPDVQSQAHGICMPCAERMFARWPDVQELTVQMIEMRRVQSLLLEMVGDLYEVAQAMAPRAGIALKPDIRVRAWQQARQS